MFDKTKSPLDRWGVVPDHLETHVWQHSVEKLRNAASRSPDLPRLKEFLMIVMYLLGAVGN